MSTNLGRSDDSLCCFYYLLQVLLVGNSEARILAVLSSEKSFFVLFFLGSVQALDEIFFNTDHQSFEAGDLLHFLTIDDQS